MQVSGHIKGKLPSHTHSPLGEKVTCSKDSAHGTLISDVPNKAPYTLNAEPDSTYGMKN